MSQQKRPIGSGAPAKVLAEGDEIFLSPRVVDRQAFNEFAAQLRELIEQAGAQAEALRSAGEEAQRTRDGLREAMNANQMKLEMASRALATIDQKAEQTRRMIDSASDVASRIDGLRVQADQIISEHVGILCQRLNEAEEASATQVDELHAKLGATLKDATEHEARLRESVESAAGPLVEQLSDLVSRAEAAARGENGLASIVGRAETAGLTASRAADELGGVRRQVEQARKTLGDALDAAVPIIDDAGAIQGHLEATVSEAVNLTRSARASMSEFIASERAGIEQDLQRLTPLVDETRAELDSILHATQEARKAAADATAGAEEAARGLAALLEQVTPWRRVLLGESADAPVGAAINAVVSELKQEIRGVAGALRAIADRAEVALAPIPPAPASPPPRRSARTIPVTILPAAAEASPVV